MQVEQLTADNWDEYASWWHERSFVPPAADIIPATSFLVRDESGEGVCAGSVYIAENKEIGFISWTITNPSCGIIKRAKALKTLVQAITNLCKEKGCPMVLTSTESSGLKKMYDRFGFLLGDTKASHYMKRL